MKKVLLIIAALASMASAQAITTVDEICGSWKTSGTYQFVGSDWVTFQDNTIVEGICTITKTGDNTVSINNLLGDDNTTMTGTVDLTAGTITIASSENIWGYYTMAGADGTGDAVATINADGTITLKGATFTYYGTTYGKDLDLTLTKTDAQPEEKTLLWSRNGKAWDSNSNCLGDITLYAYSDGTYVVTDWMGTKGYNLEFSVTADATWTSLLSIKNAYAVQGGYSYVSAGTLASNDPICYVGLYTGLGYSAIYDANWENRVAAPQEEGGYIAVYAYAYDANDKLVFSGYYDITWGPDYTLTVNPTRNAYNEKGQVQTSQITLLSQDNFDATLKVYNDGTYILKNWEGVEGYDLKFRLAGHDSITVLNEDATEVITKSGNRYWRVPTGRTDYDRACIYQNSASYNTFDITPERAYITFGCSYIYPVGSNSGKKAYYSVKGFNPDTVQTVSLRECVWSSEQGEYVDTLSFNRNNLDSVTVYTLHNEATDSTYYIIPDFLGPVTGDLTFGLANGTIQHEQLLNAVPNGNYYYYLFDGDANSSTYDSAYLYGWYSSDDDFAEGGSLLFDIYYTPAGSATGAYTFYCLNMPQTPTAISTVKADAGTSFHSLYDMSGRQLHAAPTRGMYIKDGKKYLVK